MESNNAQRQLVCESCGASFGCCAERIASCWCANVNIPDAVRADLKAKFSECICPECLAKYTQQEPAPQA